MSNRLRAMSKRYYIGARDISLLVVGSLEEAIERARKTLQQDSRRESVNIVKVVAVVRRAEIPVIVEQVMDAADDE